MGLRALLQASVAAACIAAVVAPASAVSETPAPASGAPLDVRVAEAADFSRIEFHWAGGARVSQRREGQTLILRFSRNATPDMSRLKVFPPKWLKGAEAHTVQGGLEVRLVLTDDADARLGQADGATYVNLFAKPVTASAAAPAAAAQPSPVPDAGVVRVEAEAKGAGTVLRLPWKAPLGAAVFRRGETVWVVFDTKASFDLSKVAKGLPGVASVQAVQGADYTALRIQSPANLAVSAIAEGPLWAINIAPTAAKPPPVRIYRDAEAAEAGLTAAMAGATKVVWLDDPVVGDRIGVVTALAPSKGLAARREFVDMTFLPSAHGLVLEPYATDLSIHAKGDLVRIGRPSGLALSSGAGQPSTMLAGAPQAASMPALINFEAWSRTGQGGFYARYDALQDAAVTEAAQVQESTLKAPSLEARMALARFLVGSELSFEAIGLLNALAAQHESLLSNAEFRGLRGAARVLSRRYAEAETDLSTPVLAGDASAALWRGYIAKQQGRYDEARKHFAAGYQAMNLVEPRWRARFARADAESALALGDLRVARTQIAMALAAKAGPEEDLATRIVQARLFEAQGDGVRALAVYEAVSKAPLGVLSSPAILRATQLKLAQEKITPLEAAQVFDGLRYRWRGDATEIETIRALGNLYLGLGRHREALDAMRSAGRRLPDLPQSLALQNDLASAFRRLFLDGEADGLEPVQALALFFDFSELTPIGTDGDLMVRKLARRLVDVDLLDQAANLLKYQVENRLEGVPKAQVATDLALIYLMDRKPEQALEAINASRTTVLPSSLNAERRVITARALMALGRLDHAQEIIGQDRSADVQEVRAELAWKKKEWAAAGAAYERALGDRWKSKEALGPEEESRLLRASVAFSLAEDNAALARLRTRFEGFIEGSRSPEALKIALVGLDDAKLSTVEFTRMVADNDGFEAWVIKMKQRLREPPAAAQAAAAPPAAKG